MKPTALVFAAAWAAAWFTLCGCGTPASEQAAAPAPAAAGAVVSAIAANAQAQDPFPIPVVELCGSSEQMGAEHGRRLGDTIRTLHHDYLNAYFTNPGRRMMAM